MTEHKTTIKIHQEELKEHAQSEESLHIKSQPNLIRRIIYHTLFAPTLYTLSGFFVFFIIINIANNYIFHLKVDTAVVSSMIETMTAPMNGYISEIYITTGQKIKMGEPLLKIENIDLERELQLAKLQVEESKSTQNYYQQLLANEQQRLTVYEKVGKNRIISAKTRVEIAERELITAKKTLERYKTLHQQHYISDAHLEDKHTQFIKAQEHLRDAKALRRVEEHSLKALNQGMYFTGTKTEGIEQDLYAELESAKKREKLNEEKVKIYEALIKKLTVIAPFDGKVIRVFKSRGSTTNNTQPLILIEKTDTNKSIIAYLTQNEIVHIGASNKAKVYIPSSGKMYHGKIIEVNRTDGFIDEIKAQYRWRDFQIDRSAMITVMIESQDQNAFDQHSFPGMPAVVYFSKFFM